MISASREAICSEIERVMEALANAHDEFVEPDSDDSLPTSDACGELREVLFDAVSNLTEQIFFLGTLAEKVRASKFDKKKDSDKEPTK